MEDRCPDHRVIGQAVLKGYRWIITAKGYANIVKSEKDEVYGVVYEISDSDERSLDDREIKKAGYHKEIVTVECEGKPLECLVYVDSVVEGGLPRQEYVKRINNGLSDANLPQEYIERYIRKFIPPMS